MTEQEQPEVQAQADVAGPDPALVAAIQLVREAGYDPIAMAQRVADLEADIRGAYVVIKVLMSEYVGVGKPKVIPRADWVATNPHERVQTRIDDDGSLVLTLLHSNRAERRQSKTTRSKS